MIRRDYAAAELETLYADYYAACLDHDAWSAGPTSLPKLSYRVPSAENYEAGLPLG